MSRLVPLTVDERNDEVIDLTATAPMLVTVAQCAFEMYIKASADVDDSDALVVLTVGSGLTVVTDAITAKNIDLIAWVPGADLATPGELSWHLDILVSGERHTCMRGPLKIRNL